MNRWAILSPLLLSAVAACCQLPAVSQNGQTSSFTLSVTTREVVIEIIARDRRNHNQPVRDLSPEEFRVYELPESFNNVPQTITNLRAVDPTAANNTVENPSALRLIVGGGCAQKSTFHYELAYHPNLDTWKSGYHHILVTTTRDGVTLSYRQQYYVGEMNVDSKPKTRKVPQLDRELAIAACYHSSTPSSIVLSAHLIQTGKSDLLRYSLVVQADSLAFISLPEDTRRVHLDYGVCTFDRSGSFIQFMQASAEQVLSPVEYVTAQAKGFLHTLEFSTPRNLGLTRFVVRDRATGNIGTIDAPFAPPAPDALTPREQYWLNGKYSDIVNPPVGPLGSFGSVVPANDEFCGDVYELRPDEHRLPDLWSLTPVNALYTYTLAVPYQVFMTTRGIPGVTRRTEWFGIDYHAQFWIRNPGEYRFQLSSDDGSKLYIDDEVLIDLDGIHTLQTKEATTMLSAGQHTIHVPYMQGPGISVGLILRVKPPGGDYKLFDLRDFTHSADGTTRPERTSGNTY